MKNNYPWYDSIWLNSYVQAKNIIKEKYPSLLDEFIETIDVLKVRPDFQTIKYQNVFDKKTLSEVSEFVKKLKSSELEKQELFNFGRLIVHDHPFFNQLQNTFVDFVSEVVQEPVESYYNFLSLYNNLGVCDVHMDAAYSKWTLDICIDQSDVWPIYLSQVLPWPENFKPSDKDWREQIKKDPENNFMKYTLESGEAIVFGGSNQWHFRDRILRKSNENFCHLIFFHFIPKGTRDIVDTSKWASMFGVPELAQLESGKSGDAVSSLSEVLKKT
jgi:hypothetical protein